MGNITYSCSAKLVRLMKNRTILLTFKKPKN